MGEIVLSGATGLVGRALLDALAADGVRVRALTRNPTRASFPSPTQPVQWDGLQLSREVLAGADAVIHLAGEPVFGGLPTAARRRRIRDSRIESTRRLARLIAELGKLERPRTFLCASAVGYYGDRGEQLLDEGAAPGEGFLAQVCIDWEDAAGAVEACGVRVVQVRIGVVLAAQGGALPMLALPFRLGLGGRLGSGRQWFPWIHRDDLVALIRTALTDERYQGPLNAVAPGIVTNATLTRTLGAVLSRPTLLPVPAAAIRLLAGELAPELLGSKRVVPAVAERYGFEFRHPELEEALRDVLGAS